VSNSIVLPTIQHIHCIALWVHLDPVQPNPYPFLFDARPVAANAQFSKVYVPNTQLHPTEIVTSSLF